jgi:hypothetical protein
VSRKLLPGNTIEDVSKAINIGDTITDGLFRGKVLGEGSIKFGKKNLDGYRVENVKGEISFIVKDEAKLIPTETQYATQAERDAARTSFQQTWAQQYGNQPETTPIIKPEVPVTAQPELTAAEAKKVAKMSDAELAAYNDAIRAKQGIQPPTAAPSTIPNEQIPIGQSQTDIKAGTTLANTPESIPSGSAVPTVAESPVINSPSSAPPGNNVPPTSTGGQGFSSGYQEKPGYAGNIKLDKYPEAVQPIIKDWADKNHDLIDVARRGVRSDAQVQADAEKLANETGTTFAKMQKNWKPGQAWNDTEITAVRGALRSKDQEIADLQKAIGSGQGDTTANLLRLQLALTEHAGLQQAVHGISAEAGRSLRALRQNAMDALMSDDAKKIQNIMDKLGGRGKMEDIAKRLGEIDLNDPEAVYGFIRNSMKPRLGDYLTEIFYNFILSGPPSHIANFTSNAVTALISPIERAVAAGVEKPLAAIQGRPQQRFMGEAGADLFGAQQGINEGVRKALYVIKNGYSLDDVSKLEMRHTQAFTGKIGAGINLPSRLLEASDNMFSAINYSGALNAEAYRAAAMQGLKGDALATEIANLLANPTQQMLDRAGKISQYRVFRQAPGEVTKQVIGLRNAKVFGFEPLRFIIPFIQTPVNLAKFGLERSPVQWFNPKLWQHVIAKDPKAADDIAKGILGTGIAAGLAMYAKDGLITGAVPTSATQRDAFYRQGKQPFSIKIGDKWISYQRWEPFNQTFSQVAAVVNAIEDGTDLGDTATRTVLTIVQNLTSQSYMSGLSDAMNAVTQPERYGGNFVTSLGTSVLMPFSSLSRVITQTGDPTIRKATNIPEAMQAITPGLSQNVPPTLNAFGQTQKREAPALSPFKWTTATNDPTEIELARLKVNIGFVGDSIQGVSLDKTQHFNYQKIEGIQVKTALDNMVKSSSYQNLSDTNKVKVLETVAAGAKSQAANLFFSKLPREQILQSLSAK